MGTEWNGGWSSIRFVQDILGLAWPSLAQASLAHHDPAWPGLVPPKLAQPGTAQLGQSPGSNQFRTQKQSSETEMELKVAGVTLNGLMVEVL